MLRVPLVLALATVVAGVVWAFTVGSLLSYLLVIGGVGALVLLMAPGLLEMLATFLSTGRIRNRW